MLKEKLKALTFMKRKGYYIKELNTNITYTLAFGFSTHGEKETYYLNPVLGIIYWDIKKISAQLEEDFNRETYSPLLATPIGYLMNPRGYKEWRVAKVEDVDKATDMIIENIEEYGFPFFERMSDLDNFINAFINHQYSATWNDEDYIMPVYYYLIDKKEIGKQIVEDALKKRSEMDNKYYIESYSVFAENYLKLINLNSSECEK